ncbi:MAG: D-aminoacylase [Caldilineaceae bacterium]|nr:D-aminoacylase [Caldilineaceae bacterium]
MANATTLIRNARIVDGSGSPWRFGDVALTGDRIAAVAPPGAIPVDSCAELVDAAGHVVCPGFVDILSHSILSLMVDGRSLSKIAQGVTTEVMGEGWTPAPVGGRISPELPAHQFSQLLDPAWAERMRRWKRFRDWLEAMIEWGVSPNIGSFLGGGTLRKYAMGMDMRPPKADELATMERVTAEAMEDGAFGVSFALIYPPSSYAETEEIAAVARAMRPYDGIYITHLRSEADAFMEGLEEALSVGREAEVPVQVYHLKAAGTRNWHKLASAMERISEARSQGIDITADMYSYAAAGTGLTSVLPPWAAAGDKLYENLADPAMRAKIKEAALHPNGEWEAMADMAGPEGVMPVGFLKEENRRYVGMRLSEIAAENGVEWPDAAMDLLASEGQRISSFYFVMSEENLRRQLQQPWIMISTDAGGLDPSWAAATGPYHPRAYGTYARVLGKYVREEKVIPVEDAVRKMSSALCDRLGLRDRGQLREGFYADVVIFDPETVGDKATFAEPHQLSVGVRDVWINGERVYAFGAHTGALPGRIVSGPGRVS